MIYIVNGAPGSGKTTFEDKVCQLIGENIYGYKISTIDFVKTIAKRCGWDGTKDLKNRKFLSDLKDLLTQWNDVPYKQVKQEVDRIKDEFQSYDLDFDKCAIFIDCREPWEIEKLCKGLSAKSLLIRRESVENLETSNHADAQVLNYDYDIVIENNGTIRDLALQALDFVQRENIYCNKSF